MSSTLRYTPTPTTPPTTTLNAAPAPALSPINCVTAQTASAITTAASTMRKMPVSVPRSANPGTL